MVSSTKAYILVILCVALLTVGTTTKYAYTNPQYNERIDDRLIFNSTILELSKEFDSTIGRIIEKKDTIQKQTEVLRKIVHKVKPNDSEVFDVAPSVSELDFTLPSTSERVQQNQY